MEINYFDVEETFIKGIELKSNSDLKDVQKWLNENKKEIFEKMLNNGAILFRNFPVENPKDFKFFMDSLEVEYGSYQGGGGPRLVVGKLLLIIIKKDQYKHQQKHLKNLLYLL